MKRKLLGGGKKQLFTKRFSPAGSYTWVVPPGCTEVDVFLVGAGGNGIYAGGGGGYTKTFKKDTTGWRDGNAIQVYPGESIPIVVGGSSNRSSSFRNNIAYGGGDAQPSSYPVDGGNGGSGGGAYGVTTTINNRGVNGGDGIGSRVNGHGLSAGGKGQGHTTRAFGEANGSLYADGGYAISGLGAQPVIPNTGNGGNGAGNGGNVGADGTVLIRYWAYTE